MLDHNNFLVLLIMFLLHHILNLHISHILYSFLQNYIYSLLFDELFLNLLLNSLPSSDNCFIFISIVFIVLFVSYLSENLRRETCLNSSTIFNILFSKSFVSSLVGIFFNKEYISSMSCCIHSFCFFNFSIS